MVSRRCRRATNATVIWTDEARRAWFVALEPLQLGDKVGARMAFLAAYNREVAEAKNAGRRPQFTPSIGDDARRRRVGDPRAQEKGLLAKPAEQPALPPTRRRAGYGAQSGVERQRRLLGTSLCSVMDSINTAGASRLGHFCDYRRPLPSCQQPTTFSRPPELIGPSARVVHSSHFLCFLFHASRRSKHHSPPRGNDNRGSLSVAKFQFTPAFVKRHAAPKLEIIPL